MYLFEQCLRLGVIGISSVCLPLQDESLYVLPNCKSLWIKASAKWLNVNVRCPSMVTLDALTPASVHCLWSSPKCLNRLCLTVFSSLRSSLLLVHIFIPNFFLTVNFAFTMLWYSTPWTATPFSNDPLWLTLFVEGVNDRSKSAVFPIIAVSKNKQYPEFVLYGW